MKKAKKKSKKKAKPSSKKRKKTSKKGKPRPKKAEKKTKHPIGIQDIPVPEKACDDKNCPFHGGLSVRGRIFEGEVVSDKMDKSVTIKFNRLYFVPKYERYEKRRTKIKAHNPPCIHARQGDYVKIMECRPLSKTKNFVVIYCERS